MQSYFTGAVVYRIGTLLTHLLSSQRASLEPEADLCQSPLRMPSQRAYRRRSRYNPRYSVHQFHSEILPDDRVVSVYLPPQYLERKERRFPVFYLQDGQNLFDGRTSYIAGQDMERAYDG